MVELRLRHFDLWTLKISFDVDANNFRRSAELVGDVPVFVKRWLFSRFSDRFWELLEDRIRGGFGGEGWEIYW